MRVFVSLSFVLLLAFGCRSSDEPITRLADDRVDDGEEATPSGRAGEPGVAHAQPPRQRQPAPNPTPTPAASGEQRAPDRFTVRLDTTKGPVLLDVTRAWSPNGADRFYTLVREGYYTDIAFFRVIAGFMAQVGIHGSPEMNRTWRNRNIADDPVTQRNQRGFVSYAMAGPGTRTTQFFINLVDNSSSLDSMGFAPFARVQEASMAVVEQLHAGYGEGAPRGNGPTQGRLQAEGNTYLRAEFPNLDYIRSATIVTP